MKTKNLVSKLGSAVKDAFTKDIAYQPFIDGFITAFPRLNLGQMKFFINISQGKINLSDLTKYAKPLFDRYSENSISDKIEYIAGSMCALPLNMATWIAESVLLFPGAVAGFVYNRTNAYIKGEEIEQEGLTFPEPDQRL